MLHTVAALAVLLALWFPVAHGQQTGKSWHIGFLGPPPSTGAHLIAAFRVAAFRDGLRELAVVTLVLEPHDELRVASRPVNDLVSSNHLDVTPSNPQVHTLHVPRL